MVTAEISWPWYRPSLAHLLFVVVIIWVSLSLDLSRSANWSVHTTAQHCHGTKASIGFMALGVKESRKPNALRTSMTSKGFSTR